MRRITSIIVLSLLPLLLCAQIRKREVVVDTVQVPFIHGVAIHTDLWGAIQRNTGDHGQYEVGMRLNLKDRYFPAIEVGMGHADEHEAFNEASWFKTDAPYGRIGCDYNILRNKHDIYRLFGGARFAMTHFNYDMTIGEPTSETDKTLIYTEHNDLSATYMWLEGVFGTDAKVWGPLHLGWDVRYRKMLTKKNEGADCPWYVPGLGNYKRAGFTFNFNLIISI